MEIIPIRTPNMAQDVLLGPTTHVNDPNFAEVLQEAVEAVNHMHHEADNAARDFVVGEAQSLHETMIAVEKADISLRLLTQVRNKGVEAYQEIMRMQI
jgi:flagellar hook-basal body complex protein FliE